MTNKLKTTTLSLMAAAMTASCAATNKSTTQQAHAPTKISTAARITVGSVIEYKDVTLNGKNLSVTEYHIDTDGDGKADVVRQFINRDANIYYTQVMHSPFSVLEIIEKYDEQHHMWNVTETNVIDSRKLKNAPVYMPMQKTR